MKCACCPNELRRPGKTGLCKSCFNANRPADVIERNAEAVRRAHREKPGYRQGAIERLRVMASCPEKRQKASERMKQSGLWQKGHAAITPEVIALRAARCSATKLAHIPAEYRALYRSLKTKRLTSAEREKIVLDQVEADKARWRKEWAA